jgi:hypothetical protein
MHRNPRLLGTRLGALALVATIAAIIACQGAEGATATVALAELKDSGVSGTAVVTDLGGGRARVEIAVEPAGNPDMPAHIHPGSCNELIPQPRFPLENVRNGQATTIIPVTIADLTSGEFAVTLHKSNENLKTTTACGDLVAP